ncbi:carboxylesterase from carbohydrate esterase [Wolfiporia cocos MD-104 SS10]|uniref:Carboxylic ester hydrolase n=1 Tax=Wolfiporia cocos (strain MD-104) TaxID=742152 RepID=A0A2H3J900_WOLCO|nr:carboxylesterase from carbohydrate esterase [Wolfiporia cocos MD-104 SS10]
MVLLSWTSVWLCLLPLVAPLSVPSSTSIGGDLTLLYYDDLNVFNASQHKSVLLVSPQTQSNAVAACEALGETLLPVNETFFTTELIPLLQYQVYEGAYGEDQLYWVASAGDTCQAVNDFGAVSAVSCDGELPALCSQSAGYGASAEPSTLLTVYANDLEITGFRDQRSFRFEGIPYADQPERFTYPTAWTGSTTLNATEYGSICVQANGDYVSGSEDCLFLNIYTPYIPLNGATATTEQLKPVLFWIHGGAFTGGAGSEYDGGSMVSRGDVVVVTINYRLSTLGFLALEDGVTNGNFGLADQIAALNWVREYISAFGGDVNRITIFGQSAGAASVRALLGSPQAIGKYAAALPMSNLAGSDYATTYSLYYTIPEEVSTVVEPILEETGCDLADALECLRAYNAYELVNLETVARFIVVDGTIITHTELILNGTAPIANVHTMMGYMRDDGAAFIGYPTTDNLTQALQNQYLPTSVVGNPLFTPPTGPNATLDVFNVTARVATDMEFRCLDQATAYSAIQHDLFESVWFYQFNRSYQPTSFDPNYPVCDAPIDATHPYGDPSQEYFKCHSGEVSYVFGTLSQPYRDDEDLPFTQLMCDAWTSFARTYNPNPDPAYLAARWYNSTAAHLAQQSPWLPVTSETLATTPLRTLQYQSFMTAFAEQEQCDYVGYPLNYFG